MTDSNRAPTNVNLIFMNLVQGIIRRPALIFAETIRNDPQQYKWSVVIMISFAHSLWIVWGSDLSADIVDGIAAFLVMPLVFAPLILLGLYWQSGICLAFARRLCNPDAQFDKMLAAVLWAQVPYVLLGVVFAILVLLSLFGIPTASLKLAFFITVILLFVWTLVLAGRFISQAANFSAWRGFFIYLISWFLLTVTITATGALLLKIISKVGVV